MCVGNLQANVIESHTTIWEALVELNVTTGTPSDVLVVASVIWGMRIGDDCDCERQEERGEKGRRSHVY